MYMMLYRLLFAVFCFLCAFEEVITDDAGTTNNDSCRVDLKQNTDSSRLEPTVEKTNATLLMILGFGGLSVALALLHNSIRKHVFEDSHNLDTAFDAGGRVTFSLTVVTVTSQMLWPAAYLQIPTFVVKFGLGGVVTPVAVIADILLFPMLSINLKTRAPGAKTFLQIVYARFGKPAHIVFCVVALLANLITMTSLILAGKTTIDAITSNSSDEYTMIILAVLFGSYCFIGGLGTTFYISYFNTAITFITLIVVIIQLNYSEAPNEFSFESMYEAFYCVQGPDGNEDQSLLTFRSRTPIVFACVMFFTSTSISFCDQANWQSRIAAKPVQGVLGFCVAAYMWYVIPTAISLTASLGYISMSYQNGTHLLSSSQIDEGYVFPFVISKTMGTLGGYLMLTMLTMAWMSTGSGEVMAVSSIIVYDIYKIYVNPYRAFKSTTSCPLCGRDKVRPSRNKKNDKTTDDGNPDVSRSCTCASADDCKNCVEDIKLVFAKNKTGFLDYKCHIHGDYRHYEDLLLRYKSWCIVWVTIFIIPLGLLITSAQINLNWSILFLNTLLSPFLMPLLLTFTWSKTTSAAVISGTVSGLLSAIIGNLIVASLVYPSGLDDFLTNTAADFSILGGAISGVAISTIITVIVSMATTEVNTPEDSEREWDKTMSIDNPLNPWRRLYKSELLKINNPEKVKSSHMSMIFKRARWSAIIFGLISVVLCVIVMPVALLSMGILTFNQFYAFIIFSQVICFLGAIFCVIVPPIEEILQIVNHLKLKKNAQRLHGKSGEIQLETENTSYMFTGNTHL